MKAEKYPFVKESEEHYYAFYSHGPRGIIKKLVCFRLSSKNPFLIYNLSFGDGNEASHEIDDLVVTNNFDGQKVLSTVGATIAEFLREHPGASIIAQGSTPARNRLYQIGIVKYWEEIIKYLAVFGYLNGEWKPFTRGINYEGFLVMKK